MKGIILAGGNGLRLMPSSKATNKHLMPVYDKPMIYYSLSVLMMSKIKDVLIITKQKDIPKFRDLLGSGERLGINIQYEKQNFPNGVAEAFIIGEKLGNENVCLVLGDNIIYGDGIVNLLSQAKKKVEKTRKAVIFGYEVTNPREFGVIEFKNNKVKRIVEKPNKTISKMAAIGLYFYPNKVISLSKKIKKSQRSELEITDINNLFIKKKKISFQELGRGIIWYDAGSPENLLRVSNLIYNIQSRTNSQIACLEEIAFKNKWINNSELKSNLKYCYGIYRQYLRKLLDER